MTFVLIKLKSLFIFHSQLLPLTLSVQKTYTDLRGDASKKLERQMTTMYMDNDTQTPRDRIGDEMLRRMLDRTERSAPDLPPSERMNPACTPKQRWGLENHPLGMVYSPLQNFQNLYDRELALQHGTIFRELDLPFLGESVAKRTTSSKGGCCRGES